MKPIRDSLKHLALAAAAGALVLATGAQAVPEDALIHYAFDSVDGTTVPNTGSLGSAADGTLQNATVVSGKMGNALSFTGSGSGVITKNMVTIGNAFTLACWVSTTTANGGYRRIINNNYVASAYLGTDGGANYLTIVCGNFVSSPQSVQGDGAWHHLAMTWDGTDQNFYYDGQLVSGYPAAGGGDTGLTEYFGFGCDGPNAGGSYNEAWNGKMDDAYVFGRALSAEEVSALCSVSNTVPFDVMAVPGDQQITVSWSPFPAATGYHVSRSLTAGGNPPGTYGTPLAVSGTTYTDMGLTNGLTYYYVVTATLPDSTETGYSLDVSATPAPPTTTALTLSSGTTPSIYGDELIFGVTVSGSPGPPTGTVTLKTGTTTIGTGTLTISGSDGVCSITTHTLAVGTHSNIVAVYAGDGTYATSTSAALAPAQVVQLPPNPQYYLDADGSTAGFQAVEGATYTLGGNDWNLSSSGVGPLGPFPDGGPMTIGNSASDFDGLSFSIHTDNSNAFGGFTINSVHTTVSLIGSGNNSYAGTWSVASGSTLNIGTDYGGYLGGPNWQGSSTLTGGGTFNFTVGVGLNTVGPIIQSGPVVNLMHAATYGQAAYTLQAGTLNFASASAAEALGWMAGRAFAISGGTIDNTSAAPMTLNLKNGTEAQGIIKLAGDFTFAGTDDLDFGSAPVTLTSTPQITVADKILTIGGIIDDGSSGFGLTKAGAGTLTLTGVNSYTGNTAVSEGTLSLSRDCLANGADVYLSTGVTLNLTSGVEDTIRSLYINGVPQAAGVWGANGSGAANTSLLITGTGTLNVTTFGSATTYSISGTVMENGVGLAGVTVSDGTRTSDATGSDGIYTITGVPDGMTYTVTPNLSGYTFTPANLSVMLSGANQTGKNFTTTVASGATYAGWAAANGVSGGANDDSNNDGVQNGIAYFMNATGIVTLPGPDAEHKITWTNGGNIPSSAYGIRFVVQTSPDLVTWTPVAGDGSDTNLSNTDDSLSYTLPSGAVGGKSFVRLLVMPN